MPMNLGYDLRHALRGLLRDRAFTLVAVLSLALGIGANAALFSLVDQVLLRLVPARAPRELAMLSWNGSTVGATRWWGKATDRELVTHELFQQIAAENQERWHVFTGLFARKPTSVHVSAGTVPQPAAAELVSGSYFSVLGIGAALGRVLDQADDRAPGAHPVVVLSFDYWKNRLGAPAGIVGQSLLINGHTMTVVGVAEAGFRGIDPLEAPALWLPVMMQRQASPDYAGWLEDRRAKWLHVFGRLAPGVSRQQAQAAMGPWFKAVLDADTRREGFPTASEPLRRQYLASSLEVLPAAQGRSDQRATLEKPLVVLLASTGLVLLLACLNVANLFLARGFARRRELAVRAALGASGRRMGRELLVQAALVAVAGAAIGLVLAPLVASALMSFLPDTVVLSAGVDGRVLVFALVVAAVTAVIFGVAPAVQAGRAQPALALKESSPGVSGAVRLRRALVVGQIALALVLLVGAGLFLRTLASLRAQAEVVRSELLTFRVDLSKGGSSPSAAKQKVTELLAAISALPEVETAALSRLPMMSGGGPGMRFSVGPGSPSSTDPVNMYFVSAGLFDTLGVPFTAGHDFARLAQEVPPDAEYRSAIVSESFARRYLDGRNPFGARLGFGAGNATTIEIIGVTKDFHYRGLRGPEVQVFFPALEKSLQGGTFFARTRGPARAAFASIHGAVRAVDPNAPVIGLRTIREQVDASLATERFLATLAAAFALVAIALAVVGLYAVMSFLVTRRTRELGIRLALGARPGTAVGLVVREAAALVALGLLLGLGGALALGRLVESQLYGVHARDGATITAAALLVAVVALLASALPARRAARVDPMTALRCE
jgi:predicted permease